MLYVFIESTKYKTQVDTEFSVSAEFILEQCARGAERVWPSGRASGGKWAFQMCFLYNRNVKLGNHEPFLRSNQICDIHFYLYFREVSSVWRMEKAESTVNSPGETTGGDSHLQPSLCQKNGRKTSHIMETSTSLLSLPEYRLTHCELNLCITIFCCRLHTHRWQTRKPQRVRNVFC